MNVTRTKLPSVIILEPKRFQDHRGFFSEVFNAEALRAAIGRDLDFVQDNHSLSVERGVLRGLHFQLPPMAQDKLVRVVRGSILDVALDIRRGSATFGMHVSAVLSAENWRQMLIPAGFAHGFVTLEPNAEVVYKVTNLYSPAHERGILWNDPALAIDWRIDEDQAILSPKDRLHPTLADARDLFGSHDSDILQQAARGEDVNSLPSIAAGSS
jgi:dTDP-4-dehydrorhamnose 3,5-epimerase